MHFRTLCSLMLIVAGELLAGRHCAIKINKAQHDLVLFVDGERAASYKVSTGLNPADKGRVGDMTTPEGIFQVVSVEPAHEWDHTFKEAVGAGAVRCYGPYFIRLSTRQNETFSQKGPWEGIGIHGVLEQDLYSDDRSRVVTGPSAIGCDSSEGCIRMHNQDLIELLGHIQKLDGNAAGMRVTVVDGLIRS
jgi:hypothetical protein